MATNEDLMQRLAVSKKIMDKHSEIKRGDVRQTTPMVEDYQPVNANYNLPEELLSESSYQKPSYDASKPLDEERILNSKLPDEIKRLMIEQPIVQPSSMGGGTVLSNEVIEGAQRLMKKEKISDIPQQQTQKQKIVETHTSSNINIGEIKSMIRDVVRDTVRDVVREELKDAGMLVESTQDTNEVIQFKVGQHLFIGRVTKIKKLEK
jgi:hypothetical protein